MANKYRIRSLVIETQIQIETVKRLFSIQKLGLLAYNALWYGKEAHFCFGDCYQFPSLRSDQH